ncbi:MAG: lysozyme inhibitor LprI family protein, partial [Spirochaetota bacterium]
KAPCGDPQTTHEMRRCAEYRFETADRELNMLYRRLMTRLQGDRKEKLVAAQRAWIDYRDKKAAYEASIMEGGTMEQVLYTASQASTTRERIRDLERYLEELGAR